MTANERQVGGTHYKSEYEHWDLVIKLGLNYFEGNISKYVSRAGKKNGVQDYKKAMHYLEKYIECRLTHYRPRFVSTRVKNAEIYKFALANSLSLKEEEYIRALCSHRGLKDLKLTELLLQEMINEASIVTGPIEEPNYPGTPADGGHHAGNP